MIKGTYVFSVTVKDDKGASASDEVQVIVRESGSGNPPPSVPSGGERGHVYLSRRYLEYASSLPGPNSRQKGSGS